MQCGAAVCTRASGCSTLRLLITASYSMLCRSGLARLQVVASCLDSLGPVLLSGFDSQEDLAACLRASACVPEIAGGPVEHRCGGRHVSMLPQRCLHMRSDLAHYHHSMTKWGCGPCLMPI